MAAIQAPPATTVHAERAYTPADLAAYAAAYQSTRGDARFNPEFDFARTGLIDKNDSTPILHSLAAVTPKVRLGLYLSLAPGEQVAGHHPANSGGVTRDAQVVIVGKTVPNSIVFTDLPGSSKSPLNDYKFKGGATTSNADGIFTIAVTLGKLSRGGSLTNNDLEVRDPFGRQLIRSFPILPDSLRPIKDPPGAGVLRARRTGRTGPGWPASRPRCT